MSSIDNTRRARPILLDFNSILLSRFVEEERKLWLQKNSGVTNTHGRVELNGESDFPAENAAATLLRHGKEVENILSFFQSLTSRRYLLQLGQGHVGEFQVVDHLEKKQAKTYRGTEPVKITYTECGLLHPEELNIYRCALLAALYPVLSSSAPDDLPTSPEGSPSRHTQPRNDATAQRLTPTSKECMLYDKDPCSPSSIFPVDSEDLTELVRVTFCLTHQGHAKYKERVERHLNHDPAKGLLDEMRDQLVVLRNNCHPFFKPNLFYNRECYNKWLHNETSVIEGITEEQERLLQRPVDNPTNNIPLNFKDKHAWYCKLLAKLYKQESFNAYLNEVTKEAIPVKPLSANAWRLLNEFGERYRIGELYRRIALVEYLARNFETKEWYCRYAVSVLRSILDTVNTELGDFILKEEIKMFQKAVHHLRYQLEMSLTRINRMFRRNSPEGALQAVLALFTILFEIDHVEVFRGDEALFGKGSLTYYLKKYVKEEMNTEYERHKLLIVSQLNISAFDQQSTPTTINQMIWRVSEILRNYRMYYRDEFIRYFDILEIAVDLLYGLLMQDVHELCNTYPVNHQLQTIDYRMIALAYRLSSFDADPVWERYLSLEKQTWREPFLKHSLSWMHSLHRKLQGFVFQALQRDNWQGLVLGEENGRTTSQESLKEEKKARPRQAFAKHVTVDTTPEATRHFVITPSATSAFVQVSSRSSSAARDRVSPSTSEQDRQGNTTNESTTNQSLPQAPPSQPPSQPPVDREEGTTSGNCDHSEAVTKKDSPEDEETSSTKTHSSSLSRSINQSTLSLPRSFQTCASSVGTESSDDNFVDARSHATTLEDIEDERPRDEVADDDTDEPEVIVETRLVPVSSSLVDTICVVNRVVEVVRHIAQLLCPKRTATAHDSLRMSPEDYGEARGRLETGRAKMARELSTMLALTGSLYGYYVMSVEICGMNKELLESIIGQSCLTKLRDLSSSLRDNDLTEAFRHSDRADLTAPISRNDSYPTQVQAVVKEVIGTLRFMTGHDDDGVPEINCLQYINCACSKTLFPVVMCVRLNNVRTVKSILATLIETAVETVVEPRPGSDFENDDSCDSEKPSTSTKLFQDRELSRTASTISIEGRKIIDSESVTKCITELIEIEEGLGKIMAYRANITINKLLSLLLPLNLRGFSSHKRLQPVLNATKRTLDTLASYLYHDCFAMVLRNLWQAIVKDFQDESDNLAFLDGVARDHANILLDGITYFIEIFRAEGDAISLAFISTSIEPVSQSLNLYTLTTDSLIDMYTGLRTRNEAFVEDRRENIRHRYQRAPSDVLIGKLRIELHSEQRQFSGTRFVECVAEQIRYEGNSGLGICAVPDSHDEHNAVTLGQYLVDNGVIRYVGKVIPKLSENHDEDDDLDEELQRYTRGGSMLFIPGKEAPREYFNKIPRYNSSRETSSDPATIGTTVEDALDDTEGQCSWFLNSAEVLYKFELSEDEWSQQCALPEYQLGGKECQRRDDIIRVLFTRRNVDQKAMEFLSDLQDNDLLKHLYEEYAARQASISNCCTPGVTLA